MYFGHLNFNCKSCNNKFDTQNNIPIKVSNCGHTICKPCFKEIMRKSHLCPYCRERLSDIKSRHKSNKDILNKLIEGNCNNQIQANNQQITEFWYKEKTKWYYISNNSKATGWIQWNDSWFYFRPESGEMMKGWVNDDSSWYYLHSNGEMAEGWIKWDKEWYYLNPETGSMKTGWFEWENQMYYLNPIDNGRMMIGWIDINGKKYYLNPDRDGAMSIGYLTIGNHQYYFNDNGEYAYTLDDDN